MAARNQFPPFLSTLKQQYEVVDDFFWYITAHLWTTLSESGSSVAIDADGVGGIVQLTTGATDNNEAGLFTTNELTLFQAGKSFRAGVRLQFTEANTDDANVFFGFADAPGANTLGDDGAGIAAGFNTVCAFFKTDGSNVWKLHSENGADVEATTTLIPAGGASYQELEILGNPVDGSIDEYQVTFKVDGVNVTDTNGRLIEHRISYASATEMDFGVYVKAGGANSEVVNVDYLWFMCDR